MTQRIALAVAVVILAIAGIGAYVWSQQGTDYAANARDTQGYNTCDDGRLYWHPPKDDPGPDRMYVGTC